MVPPKDMRKSGLEVSELNTTNTKEGAVQSPISGPSPLDDKQRKKKFWMEVADTSLGALVGFVATAGIFRALDAVDKEERRQRSK
jgi:hypothetical protein